MNLSIGDHCWIWHHSIVDASNGVSIGEGVQIGAFVGIFSHSSHVAIRLLGKDFLATPVEDRIGYVREPVEIGDYTFIAASSIVLPGAKIGRGCVVGAGSVVKGNIPDFSVVAGNPARIVGSVDSFDKRYLGNEEIMRSYFDKDHLADLMGKEM
ncbi:acyltransferase [Cupriavidus sp. 30B13]|uniref:acyltransferase n=1 Tax=Cupriavidus sp. 30B13 TaxID=3384241 RepID=UPI003B9202E5